MTTSDEPVEYVAEHLRIALAEDPRVSELGLDVSVRNGELHVGGTVSTEERRQAVADVAREIAPGATVRNETTVVEYGNEAGMESVP
jgi:osmotically-inducible protein OsmY